MLAGCLVITFVFLLYVGEDLLKENEQPIKKKIQQIKEKINEKK